jgi:hypothetical protein
LRSASAKGCLRSYLAHRRQLRGTLYRRDMRAALAAGALADGWFHGVRDGSGFFVMSHVMAA